jgi:hypothetical protein
VLVYYLCFIGTILKNSNENDCRGGGGVMIFINQEKCITGMISVLDSILLL